MEQKVSSTLKGLSGELKGTYYPLTGMSKGTQQQLIDDHFLFKEGDRFVCVRARARVCVCVWCGCRETLLRNAFCCSRFCSSILIFIVNIYVFGTGADRQTLQPTRWSSSILRLIIHSSCCCRFLQAANACRFWPTGRGIYHNDAKTFLVWVNEEDHLRIISMQMGGDLKQVFSRLVNVCA